MMVTGTWTLRTHVSQNNKKAIWATFEPIHHLAYALFQNATFLSQMETCKTPASPLQVIHKSYTWGKGDAKIFENTLWLLTDEANWIFDVLQEKWSGFPSQRDFVRNNLSKSTGFRNLLKYINKPYYKSDKRIIAYRKLTHDLLRDLDCLSVLDARKNERI